MIPIECFFLVVESFSFKQASFAASIFVHDFDMIFDGVFHIFLFNLCQDRLRDRSPVLSLHFSSGRPNRIVGWSYSLSNASYPLAKRRTYLGIHRGRKPGLTQTWISRLNGGCASIAPRPPDVYYTIILVDYNI